MNPGSGASASSNNSANGAFLATHPFNRASRLAAPPSKRQLHVPLFDRAHANLVLSR
jgi:hypothetical protein